jgi:hypothetical protein
MIQKMSDEHKIKFLEKTEKVIKEQKKETSKKTLAEIADEQKSKKLNNKDNGMMTSNHISSASTGVIRNDSGPAKYIKSETTNSIWNNDKTKNAAKEIDNKTKTIQEKETIFSNKREAEQKRMAEMVEALKTTDQSKSSSVSMNGVFQNSKYNEFNNSMGIFDNKDFQRLQDKTAGEKLSEEIEKKKNQKDESWKKEKQCVSSKEITTKMIEGLFTK